MHKLYELKDKLMDELEDYAENGKFSKDDVEAIKYTASAIDHICNIVEDEEMYSEMGSYEGGGGGSYEGGSYARGGGGGGRGGRGGGSSRAGGSYARGRRGGRTGRNQYGSYAGGGSYGGGGSYAYSRAAEGLSDDLKKLAEDAPDEETKMEIHKLAKKLENM